MNFGSSKPDLPLDEPSFLDLSTGEKLACHHSPGEPPGVLFCGGYTSDMGGTKALALERHCRARGRAYTRFDYRGHGASTGRFADGTIGAWRADALAIVDRVTTGPLVVVGSSIGGWIMLLVALARPERVQGLVGIAAAPDFTEDLLLPQASPKQLRALDARAIGSSPRLWWRALSRDEGADRGRPAAPAAARPDRGPLPGPPAARPARPGRALADLAPPRRAAGRPRTSRSS